MTQSVLIVEECAVMGGVDMTTFRVDSVQIMFATRALVNIVLVHS
jgi:hypothetical protein